MTEVYLKKIRQDECPSCGKVLRQPQIEQGLSVGEIGLVYASAIEAVEEQQSDADIIANERKAIAAWLRGDVPTDYTDPEYDIGRNLADAVERGAYLQEQSK
jgi:hypothetical protein